MLQLNSYIRKYDFPSPNFVLLTPANLVDTLFYSSSDTCGFSLCFYLTFLCTCFVKYNKLLSRCPIPSWICCNFEGNGEEFVKNHIAIEVDHGHGAALHRVHGSRSCNGSTARISVLYLFFMIQCRLYPMIIIYTNSLLIQVVMVPLHRYTQRPC